MKTSLVSDLLWYAVLPRVCGMLLCNLVVLGNGWYRLGLTALGAAGLFGVAAAILFACRAVVELQRTYDVVSC